MRGAIWYQGESSAPAFYSSPPTCRRLKSLRCLVTRPVTRWRQSRKLAGLSRRRIWRITSLSLSPVRSRIWSKLVRSCQAIRMRASLASGFRSLACILGSEVRTYLVWASGLIGQLTRFAGHSQQLAVISDCGRILSSSALHPSNWPSASAK